MHHMRWNYRMCSYILHGVGHSILDDYGEQFKHFFLIPWDQKSYITRNLLQITSNFKVKVTRKNNLIWCLDAVYQFNKIVCVFFIEHITIYMCFSRIKQLFWSVQSPHNMTCISISKFVCMYAKSSLCS